MYNIKTYSILVYETKDLSKKEQISFIIRFIDQNYNMYTLKGLGLFPYVKVRCTFFESKNFQNNSRY